MKKTFIGLICLSCFILCTVDLSCHITQSSVPKAQKCYYKAKWIYQQGNYKKSARLLRKALRNDPANSYFFKSWYYLYVTSGLKKAIAFNRHREIGDPMLNIALNILEGIEASSNEKFSLSRTYFENAKRIAEKMDKIDKKLLSYIYNDYACSIVFDQGRNFTPGIDIAIHLTVDIRDLKRAYAYFKCAQYLDPTNETFTENVNYIEFVVNPDDLTDIPPPSKLIPSITLSDSNSDNYESHYSGSYDLSYEYLPSNMEEILDILNKYDEVVFLIDHSGSMTEPMEALNNTPRYTVMRNILKCIIANLNDTVRFGAITVGGHYCGQTPLMRYKVGQITKEKFIWDITHIEPDGLTPLDIRLRTSQFLFTPKNNKKCILLCSDGINTCGPCRSCQIADQLYKRGIHVNILSFIVESNRYLSDYSVYDCISEYSDGNLWKINQGSIERSGVNIPTTIYALRLPQNLEAHVCFGKLLPTSFNYPLPCCPEVVYENAYTLEIK